VAVVGFDDIQIAPLLQPSLTTIRQDKRRLGWAAGQALVRLIEDPELEPPAITVPVELVVRESSGARVEEPEEGKPEGRRGAARTT
jgi:LacI family transcriptional regulator